jgi:hypothetical protein
MTVRKRQIYIFFSKSYIFFQTVRPHKIVRLHGLFTMTANVLALPEGRDFYHKTSFGELNFRLPQNCLRSTKPRLLGRCCYAFVVLFLSLLVCPFCSVLVRWLASSFLFFFAVELCKAKIKMCLQMRWLICVMSYFLCQVVNCNHTIRSVFIVNPI